MHPLLGLIRVLAVLSGFVHIVGAGMDLLGIPLGSDSGKTLGERVASGLLGLSIGLVLVTPQRRFATNGRFMALLAAHLAVIGLFAFRVLEDASALRAEPVGFVGLAVLFAVGVVPLGSAVALWLRWRTTPPNNSSKPTPLRGAA